MIVRSLGPLPFGVEAELFANSVDGRTLYMDMADIMEEGFVPVVGAKVLFRLYRHHTGVRGCEVTST